MTPSADADGIPNTAPDSGLDRGLEPALDTGILGAGSDAGPDVGGAGSAGPLVRPYTVTGGRTRPTRRLDMLTLLSSTGTAENTELNPDHAAVLGLCRGVVSVAEVAARMRQPMLVVKILISDLLERGAVTTRTAGRPDGWADGSAAVPPDQALLEQVLHGLRERL